jgi:hypothetical protein
LDLVLDEQKAYDPVRYPESETGKMVLTTRQPVAEAPSLVNGETDPAKQIIKRGLTQGLYFINPPHQDEYVWRDQAMRLKTMIRSHNLERGQFFFDVYPEALIISNATSAYDIDQPVNAMVTIMRDYVMAFTNLVASLATDFVFSATQGTSASKRLAYKFRYSAMWTAFNRLQGMPFNRAIYDYIVAHTRILTQQDYLGGPQVLYPVWASDLRGWRAFSYLEKAAVDAGWGGLFAENTQIGNGIGFDSFAEKYPNRTNTERYSYIGENQWQLTQNWFDYITSADELKSHYKMRDKDYALRAIFERMGVLDMEFDLQQLRKDVLANSPGDAKEFAKQHMTLGGQITGTFGQRDRDFRFFYDGITAVDKNARLQAIPWVADDRTFADSWYQSPGTFSTKVRNVPYWLDIYTRYREDGYQLRGISIENSAIMDVVSNTTPVDDTVLAWGYYKRLIEAGDDAIDLYGVSKEFANQFFTPSKEGTPDVFVVPAEVESGNWTVHQTHIPLIDTEDPSQCGFYLLLSEEDSELNSWAKFWSNSERSSWYGNEADLRDSFVFMGDALSLHPGLHFCRDNLAYLAYKEDDDDAGENWLEQILGVFSITNDTRMTWSIPLKPFTQERPIDLSVGDRAVVIKSKVPDISDMPYRQIAVDTAWNQILETLDGDDLVVYTPLDTIPEDIKSKLTWLWFRSKPMREAEMFGLTRIGLMSWLTCLPKISCTNWQSDRFAFFLEKVSNQDASFALSSISYGAATVGLTDAGNPIKLGLDKYQKKDGMGGSRGNSKPSRNNDSRGDTRDDASYKPRKRRRKKKKSYSSEKPDYVKGAPDTMPLPTTPDDALKGTPPKEEFREG